MSLFQSLKCCVLQVWFRRCHNEPLSQCFHFRLLALSCINCLALNDMLGCFVDHSPHLGHRLCSWYFRLCSIRPTPHWPGECFSIHLCVELARAFLRASQWICSIAASGNFQFFPEVFTCPGALVFLHFPSPCEHLVVQHLLVEA